MILVLLADDARHALQLDSRQLLFARLVSVQVSWHDVSRPHDLPEGSTSGLRRRPRTDKSKLTANKLIVTLLSLIEAAGPNRLTELVKSVLAREEALRHGATDYRLI